MQPGPDIFYKCPSCEAVLKNSSLASGNTFGAVFFSDGKRIAPMLPDIPNLTKCSKCDTILWLSDLKELGEKLISNRDYSDHPDWKDSPEVGHLGLKDLYRALEANSFAEDASQKKQREIFIRQRIWWEYNSSFDKSIDEVNAWCENCFNLLEVLDVKNNDHRCMAAELHRNLGNFLKCLKLVRELPDNYKLFKLLTMEACCKLFRPVFQIEHDRKLDEEAYYDILQNSNKELLFCIGEYEGEPDNPYIVYNGGELAVLYRSPGHAVILDMLHPDAHEQLKLAKEVLVAECVRSGEGDASEKLESGLVREYMAEMRRM
jgi:hypothetical protein